MGMEEREPVCTVGGNVNWCDHYGKTVWRFLQTLQIDQFGSDIPLLGIYPEKIKALSQGHISTLIFIAALFIVAIMWKKT